MHCESLESRRLFAGVTILTHGQSGNITGWIASAADAIQKRLGGTSAASEYVMKVDNAGGGIAVTSFDLVDGNLPLDQTTRGEAIIKLDWSNISGGSVFTDDVAAAVANYLLQPHDGVPNFTSLPFHLIGHSRGASLMVSLSWNLGRRGIWVDQLTSLDPHPAGVDVPIIGWVGDAKMRTYDNVIFADDYWRDKGSILDPDGESVDGAHNVNLNDTVGDKYLISAHMGVTAYYHGTIDLTAKSNNDHPVYSSWYGDTPDKPSRDQTGYVFSRIGGGSRPSDGVSTIFGGNAQRSDGSQKDSQWGNVINARAVGSNDIGAGQPVTFKALYNDRDSGATVTFFVDADQNPLNANTVATLGSANVASSTAPHSVSITGDTTGINVGSYFLGVKITDADGHVRYSYGAKQLTLEKADFASVSGAIVTVNGKIGNDKFFITRATVGNSPVLQITRNGLMQTLLDNGITRINLDTGDGDDIVTADPSAPAMYVFGGLGNDKISGGDGNDTLSGGAGKNTLAGNNGDDRLNGSGGRDLLVGGAGKDRLYGNGGNDTLDGGGGVDWLYGGAGDDSLSGGGSNDKLYGETGNDILKGQGQSDLISGGDGTDSATADVLDTQTSIETVI